jgi:hypothetical protein
MRRSIKSIAGLVPFGLAFMLSDKTWPGYLVALTAGMMFWIPYRLVWWQACRIAAGNWEWASYTPGTSWHGSAHDPVQHQYRMGPQGYGLYIGNTKSD